MGKIGRLVAGEPLPEPASHVAGNRLDRPDGRLALMLTVLALVIVPLGWFLFR
jgi:hypothetical protein